MKTSGAAGLYPSEASGRGTESPPPLYGPRAPAVGDGWPKAKTSIDKRPALA